MLKSRTIIVIFILFLCKVSFCNKNADNVPLFSQDTIVVPDSTKKVSPWKHSFSAGVTFNQYLYNNWAAGGNNSIAGTATIDYKIRCEKETLNFTNAISLGYGQMLISGVDSPLRKTEDKINFYSQLNYKLNKTLSYSLLLDFKSQFYHGYTYPNDSVYISTFFAPAYLTISWGLQAIPIKPLSIFLSPLSGKFTFVLDERLANNGSFGVTPAVYDEFGAIVTPGKKIRPEIGFNFVLIYKQTLAKKIDIVSKLELHNNYLDENHSNRWNFDIDWDGKIIFSITKFFSTNLFWRLIYDDDIKFPVYEEVDGVNVKVKDVAKLQFHENFGLGFKFSF